jgi:hypothetical protein
MVTLLCYRLRHSDECGVVRCNSAMAAHQSEMPVAYEAHTNAALVGAP